MDRDDIVPDTFERAAGVGRNETRKGETGEVNLSGGVPDACLM